VIPPVATVEEALFAPFIQDDRPQELARALDIPIHNPALLRLALTHRSILHEWAAARPDVPTPHSNERLEFLGDAYLGMIVAEELFNYAPDAQEGELTSWRVALVRAERLVSWAREIGLGSFLYLGAGERITESARDRMLAGAFEALIGAIALDSGLDGARDFVLRFVHRDIDSVIARKEAANPKGRLQELLQDRFRVGPSYTIVNYEGPDHARLFTAEVTIFDQSLGRGTGPSKREAEQSAARDALSRLGNKRELDRLVASRNGIMEQTSEQ
jgi:ribonuclease-3